MTQSTEANMFNVNDYLADQFRRYFPDTNVRVENDMDNEVITVTVYAGGEDADADFVFTMHIGSDDGWFRFVDTNGIVITVPFAEEMGS
jgi:hypothetical protein